MKYLILGSSGFIGTNIVSYLLKYSNDSIVLFDRIHRCHESNEEDLKRITYIEGEFTSDTHFNQLLEDVDIVIHLISTTTPSNYPDDFSDEIKENVFPILKLLDSCVRKKIKKFVFVSSGGTVYGDTKGVRAKENMSTNPICSYGIQKLTIEKYLQLYALRHDFNYAIIRLSNPYGPHQNPNGGVGAISNFVYKTLNNEEIHIWGNGNVIRDYIFIDDVAKGIVMISKYTGKEHIFNLGTGIGFSLNDIIQMLEKEFNRDIKVIYEAPRVEDLLYNVLNVDLYRNEILNNEFVPLNIGIKKMINYYKDYIEGKL